MIFIAKIKNLGKLTNRDLDILNILWNSDHSMTASEIVSSSSSNLTMNTAQAVLRKLLKNNLIKVADIVYSGTVLSRSYTPTITSEEFAIEQLTSEYQKLQKGLSKISLIAALLEIEPDKEKAREEILQLEKMLEDYKRTL